MSVCLVITFPGATPEQYDTLTEELDLDTPRGAWPEHLVSHVAGFADGALHVVDVWRSRADFDAFFASRLKAAIGKVGLSATPEVVEFPVRRHYVG